MPTKSVETRDEPGGRSDTRRPSGAARPRGGAGTARRAAGWARRAPLLPALVFLVVVTQLPFVATVVISFTRWNALAPDNKGFAALDNYKAVFTDPAMRSAIWTTVLLTVTVVLVSLVLGLGLALLLDRTFWGRGVVRTMLITPFLVVPVAAALLWKHALYNASYGLINGTLTWIWKLFGSADPPQPDWMTASPLAAVEVSLIWQWTPFMMLILLAGLQSRPADAVEAARVDGASAFDVFRYLTLPHLRRYLELAALLGTVYVVQNFDAVFTITSGGLGTANLPYTIYQTFYQAHDYGRASAQGVVVVVCSLLVATFALRTVSSLLREEVTR
ncbi:carbohydrate ABC transporter permease [Streptomyces sp. Ac-502]|uniref:carbohydrate ABC transporter permease n=1 Tax=Streptomyces sp. Ac-502 TaxID=3342801 RepID=UPI003862D274